MANVTIRNRNAGKFDKDGRKKQPSWEYRFDAAKIDGKRQQISKGGFKTKSEAEIEGNKAFADYNNAGSAFEPSEISVTDYMHYWLESYCRISVTDSTYDAYKSILNTHIIPIIGSYKLCSITTLHLQELINNIYINKGFSFSYMKSICKVLKGAFKYAYVTSKLIKTNPATDVSLPKINSINPLSREIKTLSKFEVNRILDRFKGSPYQYYAILTSYYTGLRIGEVYGLTWDCINFEEKTLTVNKSAKKIETERTEKSKKVRGVRGKSTTKWYFGECKNSSSYRTISIGDTLLNALKEYKLWQEEKELIYNEYYVKQYARNEETPNHRKVKRLMPILSDVDVDIEIPYDRVYPVFIKENGEYHGTDSIKYVSKVINIELEICFNFHMLRHTHATMLVESGLPIKSISERLGHNNVRTTLETYVHVTDNMRNDVVDKFETIGDLGNDKIISISQHKASRKFV